MFDVKRSTILFKKGRGGGGGVGQFCLANILFLPLGCARIFYHLKVESNLFPSVFILYNIFIKVSPKILIL